jgi:toxin FitB
MAGLLLDTDVISATARAAQNPAVFDWIKAQVADDLFLSAVTVGELTRGIERLPPGRNRTRLAVWLDQDVSPRFVGRILPFDQFSAAIWGKLMAHFDNSGTPRSALDMQIAAIALHHGMTLATRNTRDFVGTSLAVVNPWTN